MKPTEVIALRKAAGLTQTAAAKLVRRTLRTWQNWEAGVCRPDPAAIELFKLKALVLQK